MMMGAPHTPNYDSMTKSELVEYAETMSIELFMTMTKAEMIEILEGAENGENDND